MAEYFIIAAFDASVQADRTRYGSVLGRIAPLYAVDGGELIIRGNATWSNLGFYSSLNTATFTLTITSRVNAVAGNQSLFVPAATTGFFEDLINSDVLSDGDLICYKAVTTAGAGVLVCCGFQSTFDASFYPLMVTDDLYCANGDYVFTPIYGGTCTEDSETVHTENAVQAKFYHSTTLTDLSAECFYNGVTDTSELVLRINNGDGNLGISIPASTTGDFEDIVNTDNISPNDKVCLELRAGATGGDYIDLDRIALKAVSDTQLLGMSGSYDDVTEIWGPATYYQLPQGPDTSLHSTTEADDVCKIKSDCDVVSLYIYVWLNNSTNALTTRARINGGNGNLVISVPAGLTGSYEDAVNSDALVAGDLFDISQSIVDSRAEISVYQEEFEPTGGPGPGGGGAFSAISSRLVGECMV